MSTITTIAPDERFHTQIDWLDTFHIYNFSHHYRNGRSGFGDLLVMNDDKVSGNRGFGMHPHHDMEIVTWVLSGTLAHEDNQGNKGTITPGEVQQMSAGSGVLHSEVNPTDETCHLLQMWVLPDKKGVTPRYQQENVSHLIQDQLGLVASGEKEAPIHLHNDKASLYVGRFSSESEVTLPHNELLYIYIARGSATFAGEDIATGTSIHIRQPEENLTISVSADSEIVIWSIDDHARLQSNFRD
jgi:redox-sensitive bicupin YhaK (pirin superfamily)